MSEPEVIHRRVVFQQVGRRRVLRRADEGPIPIGRIPRVSRFLALAIHLDGLIRLGHAPDFAAIARLGHVSRARMSQIMNLTLLAPGIQQDILFLPPVAKGRDPITECDLRPIAAEPDWQKQRRLWSRLLDRLDSPKSGLRMTSISRATRFSSLTRAGKTSAERTGTFDS